MLKKMISACLLAALLTLTVSAHTAAIETSGESEYSALRLTPQIYNNANRNLSDLLIKDKNGENAPYFISTGSTSTNSSQVNTALELIHSYLMEDDFYFDYRIASAQSGDTLATSLELKTGSSNFAKSVDVYGSHDNINWEYIKSDRLYVVDGASKLSVIFQSPQKFTHYRLKLDNNLEKISFDLAYLVYDVKTIEESYFIEMITAAYTVEQDGKNTRVLIEGLKNLRLCDLTLHTQSTFSRMVGLPGGPRKELFNLTLGGTSYSDTTLPLDHKVSGDDALALTIANNDDKPIDLTGITVRYYADELVFGAGAGGPYTLVFGADASKTAPVYDIGRYKDDILAGELNKATLGAIQFDYPEEKPPARDYTFVFNAVVIVIALMLGVIILFRLKA